MESVCPAFNRVSFLSVQVGFQCFVAYLALLLFNLLICNKDVSPIFE